MKKLIQIIVMMVFTIITIKAQNTDFIDLKKGKDLGNVKIHEYNQVKIVYEKNGSLHDQLISNINYFVIEGHTYRFDESGELISPKNLLKKGTNISMDTTFELSLNNSEPKMTNDLKSSDTFYIENNQSNIEIHRLKKLYDEGLIDENEYAAMKLRIIESEIMASNRNEITNKNISSSNNIDRKKVIKQAENNIEYSDNELFAMGYKDGEKYYNTTQPFATGVTFGCIPVLGVLPTIVCGLIPPINNNVNFKNPNYQLANNKEYYTGYKKAASKQKLKNVWGGYLTGTLSLIAIILIAK